MTNDLETVLQNRGAGWLVPNKLGLALCTKIMIEIIKAKNISV